MSYIPKQKFHPSWVIASLILSLAVVIWLSFQEGALVSGTILAIISFLLLLHAALLAARLHIIVNEEGIRYRFFPFHLRPHRIYWDEVEEARLRTFSVLNEFGGWGIRYNFFSVQKLLLPEAAQDFFLK